MPCRRACVILFVEIAIYLIINIMTIIIFGIFGKAGMPVRQQPLADVSTPGHGQGEGPARYEFRLSGTKEIVGGAEVSEANGVPPAVDCLTGRNPGYKTKERLVFPH